MIDLTDPVIRARAASARYELAALEQAAGVHENRRLAAAVLTSVFGLLTILFTGLAAIGLLSWVTGGMATAQFAGLAFISLVWLLAWGTQSQGQDKHRKAAEEAQAKRADLVKFLAEVDAGS